MLTLVIIPASIQLAVVRHAKYIHTYIHTSTYQGQVHTRARYIPGPGTYQGQVHTRARYIPGQGTYQGQVHTRARKEQPGSQEYWRQLTTLDNCPHNQAGYAMTLCVCVYTTMCNNLYITDGRGRAVCSIVCV